LLRKEKSSTQPRQEVMNDGRGNISQAGKGA
jgi:hypothetical protein